MQILVRFFCKNRRIPSDTMNDEEVRAHHPTSLMDENEGCIFLSPMHGRCKEKRYKAKKKSKEKKIQGKKQKGKKKAEASCSPYAKASIFFDEPNGFLFLCAYISSYASIAAIYPHKIDRILFYSSKKMLECLHMCNFCCTFAPDFKLAKYSRF